LAETKITDTNTAATIAQQDKAIENEQLKSANDVLTARITVLEKALDEANAVIESDIRAKKVNRLKAAGVKLKDADYAPMSLDQIDALEKTVDLVMPTYRSVRPGVQAKSEEEGLTVGDLSVISARRKGGN